MRFQFSTFSFSFIVLALLGLSACGDNDNGMSPRDETSSATANISYNVDGQSGSFDALGFYRVADSSFVLTLTDDSLGIEFDTFVDSRTLFIGAFNVDTSLVSDGAQIFNCWIVGYDGPGAYGPLTDSGGNSPRGFSLISIVDAPREIVGGCGFLFFTNFLDDQVEGVVTIDVENANRLRGSYDVRCGEDQSLSETLSGTFQIE